MTLFFSNSNIDSAEEFERRLKAARALAEAEGLELVVDEYNHQDWLEQVAKGMENEPEKGARCDRCFRYNLARAAVAAARFGCKAFTTSLTVSPHKISSRVFAAGRAAAQDTVGFLDEDFKKMDGFLESLRRTKELGLYRQSYCGCEFSHKESEKWKQMK